MRRLRVLVLTHSDLVPPDRVAGLSDKEIHVFEKEYDVAAGLRALGHDVQILGVSHDLGPLRQHVEGWEPHLVFNLLMEFQDIAVYQAHVVAYLELLRVPYAGCNPRGLLLARDKPLAKRILRAHRIPTPRFALHRRGRRVRIRAGQRFPAIVKSANEEASRGISQASVVHDAARLAERVAFVHERVRTDAIVEEFVPGRELTIGVLGNDRLETLPVWEIFFDHLPGGAQPIQTARVKWDLAYQKRHGIRIGAAEPLDPAEARRIARLARRVYRALGLSGYARIDLRLDEDGRIHVIEANPNPDLTREDDFATSAAAAGLAYPKLLQRIVSLGLRYRAPWAEAL